MPFLHRSRCQLHSIVGRPSLGRWPRLIMNGLRGHLRLRSRWRASRKGEPPSAARLGSPSRFETGAWVRILGPDRVFATLDRQGSLRGLHWLWQQWSYCGSVHRVLKPVRRMMDDDMRIRPISSTVLLDTVPCTGPDGTYGCGRDCPMMFRDEWLEEVQAPAESAATEDEGGRYATVRAAAEIEATLDRRRGRKGLMFMPEMFGYAGQRFRVRRRLDQVLVDGYAAPVPEPVYLLEGLHCAGAAIGEDGPCDRGCRLLWHQDWLRLE